MLSRVVRTGAKRLPVSRLMPAVGSSLKPQTQNMSVVAADEGTKSLKIFHGTGLAAAVVLPAAIFSDSGSNLHTVCDWAAAGLIPLHGHIGLNWIISDYVPKASQGNVRVATLVASVLTLFGLVRINLQGDGVIDTISYLWEPPKTEETASE